MRALVLNGSPKGRESNSLKLAQAFLSGAGCENAEIIDVYALKIGPCRGCFGCWTKTPGSCVIQDDMACVLQKIAQADLLIWSFPLYYFSIPGGLKNLIDRQLPLALPFMAGQTESGGHPSRIDRSKQRQVVISTCGFWTSQGNYDAVNAQFSRLCEEGFTALYCGQGELFRVPELKARTEEYLDLVRQAGAEFAGGGISAGTGERLLEPLYPREVFERMADASWGVAQDGEAGEDESYNFTAQMAALYLPDGKARVIEFYYGDIGKRYQIVCEPGGHRVLKEGFLPYTTRIETPYTLWRAIARGEASGQEALFSRKYSVLGDFELMMRWDELFGGRFSKAPAPALERKTNMGVLLAPWIVIWVAMAIDKGLGGVLGVLSAALLPLVWLKVEATLYERLSVPLVAGLSLAVLCGASAALIVPLSYLLFGLMWLLSGLAKLPLTALYSQAGYGGKKAFENPLFMHTNRILTFCWAGLYLITPIWTYFLMESPLSAFTGLINSVMPAVLGAFTAWFQGWYPRRYARG
ncbi:MAG: NAD(P)H-dependent oxidoreductase [Christensenellaceae bacterium]|jgi:multimeric flavodoxin WrbA|nr:NAD(P)H-dependent oxidoreductase [Christensenellaceae bacterium]